MSDGSATPSGDSTASLPRGRLQLPATGPDIEPLGKMVLQMHAEGWSIRRIAHELGMSRPRTRRVLSRAGMAVTDRGRGRPRPSTRLPRPDGLVELLEDLYVRRRLTRRSIAELLDVPEHRVRTWLAESGIRARSRGAWNREDRRQPVPEHVEKLYVESELPAEEVGLRIGSARNSVLQTLHEHRDPVRVPHTSRSHVVLDELYRDAMVLETLARHDVPRVVEPGRVDQRFPVPVALNATLLADLYLECGLSVLHIELLTGQPADTVRRHLRRHAIPRRRPGGLSPFSRRVRGAR